VSQTPYPKQLSEAEFVDAFGSIYEHSPWVAETVYPSMTPGIDAQSMAEAMRLIVDEASDVLKLELLYAHPDLAGRLSLAELTESSRSEQTGAGLDQCTPAELAEFQELNNAYIEKFGFPFIFAVKGFHRTDILEAFRVRVHHSREEEFKTAIEQVHRIARLRLETTANEC
jgi:2-oxo-4-hydroxy-4-carboxy-5-ureidoimidazoline decarboxylase